MGNAKCGLRNAKCGMKYQMETYQMRIAEYEKPDKYIECRVKVAKYKKLGMPDADFIFYFS